MESIYYDLFELMSREHGLSLLETELQEIIQVSLKITKDNDEVFTFDTAPTDGTPMLAWHRLWRCWMPVKRIEGKKPYHKDCEWIDCTLSNAWPTAAFTHWMKMLPAPE